MADAKKSSKSSDAKKKSTEKSGNRTNTGASQSKGGERSTGLRLLDFYLEQSEKSTSSVLNTVGDVQAVWNHGLRTALGTGRIALDALEEDLPLDATERFMLDVSDTVSAAQKTIAEASMQVSIDTVKALRKQLGGDEGSKQND